MTDYTPPAAIELPAPMTAAEFAALWAEQAAASDKTFAEYLPKLAPVTVEASKE